MKSLYSLFIVTTLLKVLMGYLAINVSNVVTYNKVFSQQIALDVPQCLAYCYKCMYLKESQTIFVSNWILKDISSLCLKICNAYRLNENFHYIITFPGQKNKREVVLFKCRVVLKHSMDVDGKVHMKKFRSYAGVSDEDRKITT